MFDGEIPEIPTDEQIAAAKTILNEREDNAGIILDKEPYAQQLITETDKLANRLNSTKNQADPTFQYYTKDYDDGAAYDSGEIHINRGGNEQKVSAVLDEPENYPAVADSKYQITIDRSSQNQTKIFVRVLANLGDRTNEAYHMVNATIEGNGPDAQITSLLYKNDLDQEFNDGNFKEYIATDHAVRGAVRPHNILRGVVRGALQSQQ